MFQVSFYLKHDEAVMVDSKCDIDIRKTKGKGRRRHCFIQYHNPDAIIRRVKLPPQQKESIDANTPRQM